MNTYKNCPKCDEKNIESRSYCFACYASLEKTTPKKKDAPAEDKAGAAKTSPEKESLKEFLSKEPQKKPQNLKTNMALRIFSLFFFAYAIFMGGIVVGSYYGPPASLQKIFTGVVLAAVGSIFFIYLLGAFSVFKSVTARVFFISIMLFVYSFGSFIYNRSKNRVDIHKIQRDLKKMNINIPALNKRER